jgi:hypothetical protein
VVARDVDDVSLHFGADTAEKVDSAKKKMDTILRYFVNVSRSC